jgi:hypothetical protein
MYLSVMSRESQIRHCIFIHKIKQNKTKQANKQTNKQTYSWPLVCERAIPTERPPLVGEVSAKFCGVAWWAQRVPRPYSRFSRPQPLFFLPSSYSVVLTRLSGPRFRPTTTQKIWLRLESNPDTWLSGTLTSRPQRWSTFFYITYINSVRTSQEAQYISVM